MAAVAPIALGQRFDSLQGFKTALRNWAVEACFTPAILDSDSRRVRVGCRSSKDCPFRIRCNSNADGNYASVTIFEGTHTCASSSGRLVSQDIKRAEVTRLKFLLAAVPQLIDVTPETATKSIIDAVQEHYGQKIALRQAQKVKAILSPKNAGPCQSCGAVHHGLRCPSARTARPANGASQGMVQTEESPGQLEDQLPNEPQLLETDDDTVLMTDPIDSEPPDSEGLDDMQQAQMGSSPVSSRPASMRGRTAQEVRNEAARLMQRAAELMQEAAQLNAEAARLTASVANE